MEENKKNNITVINLASVKPVEVIEVYNRTKEWIAYGVDNDYFQYVIDRYNGSTTNSAAINGITKMIYGGGLSAKDAASKPNEYANMLSIFKKRDLRNIVFDYKLQGMAAMQIIWSKDHKKVVEVAHIPMETLRPEVANEDGDIEAWYYAKDWTNIYGKRKPVRIPSFEFSKEGLEIYVIKTYRPGSFYFATPDYQASLVYARYEENIAAYHLNNVENGFSPKTIINFNNGQATDDESKRAIVSKFEKNLTGQEGKPLVFSFNDNVESQTTFQTIPISDAADEYQFSSKESMEKIMIGHSITSPMLFGLATTNGFASNADELKNASIYMNNKVIKPFQEELIDAFDDILAVNGISLKLFFKTLQPWKSEDEVSIDNSNNNTPESGDTTNNI